MGFDENSKPHHSKWVCECDCKEHTIKSINTGALMSGASISCGCIPINKDLTGMTFGMWKVLRKLDERYKDGCFAYECQCSCEKKTIKILSSRSLTRGSSRSCGCIATEKIGNEYDLSGEYGVGKTINTNKEFYFNLEDYEKIKDYTWQEGKDSGYIHSSRGDGIYFPMHRLIMDIDDENLVVDHIYHQLNDLRKKYLRVITKEQNSYNRKLNKNNPSGVTGVTYHKKDKNWVAHIGYKKKRYIKEFKNFDEAVSQRKVWEQEFFGDFAYQEPPEEYLAELQNT